MPHVEEWIQEEVQRYDSALEILWGEDQKAIQIIGKPIPFFIVAHKHKAGIDLVMVLRDKEKNFLKPHPKLILYGDESLGIKGLYHRDLTKRKDPKDWIREVENKEESSRVVRYLKGKEIIKDIAKEVYYSSAVHPRVYIKNPFAK